MKNIILLISFIIIISTSVVIISEKTGESNSEIYKENEEVTALMRELHAEYGHDFQFATKKIEKQLYGKWQVTDNDLGYSLKYDVTGDGLREEILELSKELVSRSDPGDDYGDYIFTYESPVLVYYNETLGEMAEDDFLDNYSGIKGINPDTIGTVVVLLELFDVPEKSIHEYRVSGLKFLLIDDYVIAVNMSTFYQLQRIGQ